MNITKEEAEVEIYNREAEAEKRFCPLIKENCKTNCVAFKRAIFSCPDPNNPGHGYVVGGYCVCAALQGDLS